ncbi:MAG: Ig-like domain-containing protein, partial [Candidatus Latescibacterota bacterium]
LDPFSPNYLTFTSNLPFGGTPPPNPIEAQFTGSADTVFVWAWENVTPLKVLQRFDTSDYENFLPMTFESGFAGSVSGLSWNDRMRLSPRGDRLIIANFNDAFNYYDTGYNPIEALDSWSSAANTSYFDMDYTPDASRFYAASVLMDSVLIFDFTGANSLEYVSGSYQTGVVNTILPAPFRVRATLDGSLPAGGVPITFTVESGGGTFPTGGQDFSTIVVATDPDGYAEVDFRVSSIQEASIVNAISEGLVGSPRVFVAGAVEDPSTLPLRYSQILPVDGAIDVSVTTAIQVTFSRGVDPATIDGTTLTFHEAGDATPLPVVYGFTDGDRKVSMTPVNTLDYNTSYVVDVTAGIQDKDSGALDNPVSRTFTTQSPPPPSLASISPPSGTSLITVTLSGAGFDPTPGNNAVLFNDLSVSPSSGGVNKLYVTVPTDATSGIVRVAVGPDTSNAKPFNVLVQSTTTVDDVIGSVGTIQGQKTVTVSPDGAVAYSVSAESDNVIPIGVDSLATYPGIPVGDQPVAIVMHPWGTSAYVTNFGSASVSVLGNDGAAPSNVFNKVTSTLVVGANPLDVAVLPDGSRIYVANSGSNTLSVIDGDTTSSTHDTVIGSVGVPQGAKTVTVSPDGTRLYVGTNSTVEILETTGNSVIGSVGTVKGVKTTTISPDGGLLFVVTTEGEVLIVDVEPGSATENSVIGSVGTVKGVKTTTVSPDGGLLYLIQNDSDEVIIVNVETIGSVSVIESPVVLPPKRVNVVYVDTLETFNGPDALAFDPRGNGQYWVTTAGDGLVTLYGETSKEYAADIRVTPRTLNLQSRGRYVTGSIELSPPATVDVHDIDVSTVRLQDVIPPVPGSETYEDVDADGFDELVVKFCREEFQEIMPQGEYVPVSISGEAGIHTFVGWDTIRTIRPQVVHPKGGEFLTTGEVIDVVWTSPSGANIDYVDVHYSLDDGESWEPIAEGVPDAGTVSWLVPTTKSEECRVMVTIYRDGQPIGMGMSPGMFTILGPPVAVSITGFEASIEEGKAVMRWTTGFENGTAGFNVLRSESEEGVYQRVTEEMIDARGGVKGASYEYRDGDVHANRRYFYKLEEIVEDGPSTLHGPYEVVYKITFDLAQNTPNPFNPTTAIRYSIAEAVHVRLMIYDVAGRRVRTLVDGNQRADMYKVVWDGTNDLGQPVATGVYFYRITAGKFVRTKKMLLLK